jgi:hypothetical protein
MCGQVTQGILTVLLGGLLLGGCGSSKTQVDGPPLQKLDAGPTPPDAPAAVSCPQPDASDAVVAGTCDEDALGESYFIINCTPGGGGTPVLRQDPVPYPTCKNL